MTDPTAGIARPTADRTRDAGTVTDNDSVRTAALLVLGLLLTTRAAAGPTPALIVEAPPAMAAAQRRVESYDVTPLADVVRMVGLDEPGPPIKVVLADTRSDWSAGVPAWTAGYALGAAGRIVLFPARSPGYPHDTLEDVLRHEVAHILISRAAGHRAVPRWFHEGLAVTVERRWGLEDRTFLASNLMFRRRPTLRAIDTLFSGGREAQARAYSLSAAVVRDLLAHYGNGAPAAILGRVAQGATFDAALARVTGRPLPAFEADFWTRQRTWTIWVPLLASSSVMWLAVVALAALAWRRRRLRGAQLRQRWAADDAAAGARDSGAGEPSADGERLE